MTRKNIKFILISFQIVYVQRMITIYRNNLKFKNHVINFIKIHIFFVFLSATFFFFPFYGCDFYCLVKIARSDTWKTCPVLTISETLTSTFYVFLCLLLYIYISLDAIFCVQGVHIYLYNISIENGATIYAENCLVENLANFRFY